MALPKNFGVWKWRFLLGLFGTMLTFLGEWGRTKRQRLVDLSWPEDSPTAIALRGKAVAFIESHDYLVREKDGKVWMWRFGSAHEFLLADERDPQLRWPVAKIRAEEFLTRESHGA